MFYEVVPVGKIGKLIYFSDDSLLPGQIVLVTLGKRTLPAIVYKKVAQPNFKCKKILQVLYSKPIPTHLLKIIDFFDKYYLTLPGATASLLLPKGVEKRRRKTEHLFGKINKSSKDSLTPPIPLNPHQKNALIALQEAPGATKLLHGVTGSGKTNIYLKMAENALKQQKSIIVLVPEIALTSQLIQVFNQFFKDNITLIHSKQTEAERHLIFNSLLESDSPKIIIGPRSALFAPLNNIGLIIIDEEHDYAYYQENSPRYSTVRIASFMAKTLNIPLILGSATPTIEDYYLAKQHNSLITLNQKAKSAKKPIINVIDLKNRDNFTRNHYFSNSLLESISDNLKNHQQTLIFHNRRGSSPLTICEYCGTEIVCPNCFLPLTLHADQYELVCHTCNHHEKVPTNCPNCRQIGMIHKGFGTKLLETELKKLFPQAKIARFDADNKKTESLEAIYDVVKDGKIDILVGTQTLAKGLDLPKLATVGIVQADAGLSLPDYSAEERTFQLLTQVIGRVGRGHITNTNVFIQTYRPEHQIIKYAVEENYLEFYNYIISERKKSGFPPFRFIAKLEITLKTESLALKKVRSTIAELTKAQNLVVSPPIPTFHERTIHGYTWQIIIRAKSRTALLKTCQNLDPNFKIILDPPSLL